MWSDHRNLQICMIVAQLQKPDSGTRKDPSNLVIDTDTKKYMFGALAGPEETVGLWYVGGGVYRSLEVLFQKLGDCLWSIHWSFWCQSCQYW